MCAGFGTWCRRRCSTLSRSSAPMRHSNSCKPRPSHRPLPLPPPPVAFRAACIHTHMFVVRPPRVQRTALSAALVRLTWHCPFAVGYRNVGMRGTVAAPSLVVLGEYCRWGALSSAVTSGATWHNTEAVLYAFRAIGRFIPTDEAAIIPQVRWATRRSLERTIRWCTFNRATLRLHSQLRPTHTGTARAVAERNQPTLIVSA